MLWGVRQLWWLRCRFLCFTCLPKGGVLKVALLAFDERRQFRPGHFGSRPSAAMDGAGRRSRPAALFCHPVVGFAPA